MKLFLMYTLSVIFLTIHASGLIISLVFLFARAGERTTWGIEFALFGIGLLGAIMAFQGASRYEDILIVKRNK